MRRPLPAEHAGQLLAGDGKLRRSAHCVVRDPSCSGMAGSPGYSSTAGMLVSTGSSAFQARQWSAAAAPEPAGAPGGAGRWPHCKLLDAVGILTVAEMLRTADRCRSMATPGRHLDEVVVERLFFAVRGLAELVCRDVRPG